MPDEHHYKFEQALSFKVARHPSETAERTWLRVLAFAWKWREGLAFGPGLCEPEAPEADAAVQSSNLKRRR